MNILKKVRWRIFKVKQRGNFSYEEKMDKDNGKVSKDKSMVGYNWPYDYFSLVENVKLSVDVELKKDMKDQEDSVLAPEGGYTGTGIGGDPLATDAFDLEIGAGIEATIADSPETFGQSTFSSAGNNNQNEDRYRYTDAKQDILEIFRNNINIDLNQRGKTWDQLNNRRKRRYVKRAVDGVKLTLVYQDLTERFPNIVNFVNRLKPADF